MIVFIIFERSSFRTNNNLKTFLFDRDNLKIIRNRSQVYES